MESSHKLKTYHRDNYLGKQEEDISEEDLQELLTEAAGDIQSD